MKTYTPEQIAYEIVKDLSKCKYASEYIIGCGVDAFENRHQVKVDEYDRAIAIAKAKKALNDLFDKRHFFRSMGM